MEEKELIPISANDFYKIVDATSILEAVKYIADKKISLKQSTKYSVIISNEPFPPKEVMRISAILKGYKIDDATLFGGQVNKPFEKLGFSVIGNEDYPFINLRKFQPQIKKYNYAIANSHWLKDWEIYKFNFINWIQENIDFKNDSNEEIKAKIELSQEQNFTPNSSEKGINFIKRIKQYNDDYITIDDIIKLKKIAFENLPLNKENLSLSFGSFPRTSTYLSLFAPEKFIAYDNESLPAYKFLSENNNPPQKNFKAFQFYQIFYQNIKKLLKESQIDIKKIKEILNVNELSELHWNFIAQDFLLYITRKIMNATVPAYYCVGFHFYGEDPTNQLPRFIENGIWENGYDDKFLNIVKGVPIGALIAAKTSYTMNEDNRTISVLEVHCIGKVIENYNDGRNLKVDWEQNFERKILKNRGGYRNTISQVHNEENIKAIFYNDSLSKEVTSESFDEVEESNFPLNQILFGAPGTGKTFDTKRISVEIINGIKDRSREEILNEYEWLKNSGQIQFTTFHQSMSYEDFIEGIKPESIESNVIYEVKDGIFKKISKLASREVSNTNKTDSTVDELLFDDAWNALIEESQNSIENGNHLTLKTITSKDIEIVALSNQGNLIVKPKVENALEYTISYYRTKKLFESFPDFSSIKNIDKDFRTIIGGSNSTAYWSVLNYIHQFLKENTQLSVQKVNEPIKKYVLIIDEINRGNVSAIFGELITLIEDDKRKGLLSEVKETIEVKLPYSNEPFSVPDNLYIIGTMNTADRSVEALDTALRRRFSFIEVSSNPEILQIEHPYSGILNENGDEIDLIEMLKKINQRIELLIDKDHQIGHSYFIKVNDFSELKTTFKDKIIPLLEEYFYGDFGKIGLVLGASFIRAKYKDLAETKGILATFRDYEETDFIADKKVFELNSVDELNPTDFISIYNESILNE